jgi:hypothetical protein
VANLQTITIAAPGFSGLNTQDSPTDIPPEFCSVANNCVIDKFGRIAARKGYQVTTSSGNPEADLLTVGYFSDSTGTTEVFSSTASGIYRGTTTMTLDYNTSVTDGHWQMLQFQDRMIFLQRSHAPLQSDEGDPIALLGQTVGLSGDSLTGANCGLAAFSRLWLANTDGNKTTVYWSDIRNPTVFNSGSAGQIFLEGVWPTGNDEIIAMAAHNGFLVIFGFNNILMYQGAEDPATMVLVDTVKDVGCVARDSVKSVGNDLLFLSASGVRSLGRTVQTESLPYMEASGTVRDELIARIPSDINVAKSVYSPEEAFYALFFPDQGFTYVLTCVVLCKPGASVLLHGTKAHFWIWFVTGTPGLCTP